MKRIFWVLLAIILIGLIGFAFSGFPIGAAIYGGPDKKDLERFSVKTIAASDNCFEFQRPANANGGNIKVNDWTRDLPFFNSLQDIVSDHSVRSFLLIQRDSILFEYYGLGTDKHSMNSSYSIAKAFTSALIGIAIDEGSIASENDLVLQYLPSLKGDAELKKLSIKHLLNQTSGIKYRLKTDAQIYYGSDMSKTIKYLEFDHNPGEYQHYLNINIQLLGYILQSATNKSPATYLEEKIWSSIGSCDDAIWAVDKTNEMEKTYCCMGATALDYAKFGRLYLNKGNWQGEQIVSQEWVQKSLARDSAEGSSHGYNYCWHIGLKEYGDFMANGMYKQHIYVHPDKEIIIVLLNDQENRLKENLVNWWYVFRQIVDQL